MEPLKPSEQKLMDLLKAHEQDHGFSPSYEEIKRIMGYRSKSSVQNLLKSLERKGRIKREPNKSRTIQIVDHYDTKHGIPFLGTIAAGGIVESFTDHPLQFYPVSEALNKPENYALRVIGDSMIEEHICNNDVVILSRNLEVNRPAGSDCGGSCCRRGNHAEKFYQDGADVILEPANSSPEFAPMKRDASLVQVQGVLVSMHRPFLHSNLG